MVCIFNRTEIKKCLGEKYKEALTSSVVKISYHLTIMETLMGQVFIFPHISIPSEKRGKNTTPKPTSLISQLSTSMGMTIIFKIAK